MMPRAVCANFSIGILNEWRAESGKGHWLTLGSEADVTGPIAWALKRRHTEQTSVNGSRRRAAP